MAGIEMATKAGATFERTYHGVAHTLTVTRDGFTVDGKKTVYASARKAAFAVIGAEAAESWPSLDGKQFWHIRSYVAPAEAKPAAKKAVKAPTKAKATAKKVTAKKAPAAKAKPATARAKAA